MITLNGLFDRAIPDLVQICVKKFFAHFYTFWILSNITFQKIKLSRLSFILQISHFSSLLLFLCCWYIIITIGAIDGLLRIFLYVFYWSWLTSLQVLEFWYLISNVVSYWLCEFAAQQFSFILLLLLLLLLFPSLPLLEMTRCIFRRRNVRIWWY